jgi:hypothetical protein
MRLTYRGSLIIFRTRSNVSPFHRLGDVTVTTTCAVIATADGPVATIGLWPRHLVKHGGGEVDDHCAALDPVHKERLKPLLDSVVGPQEEAHGTLTLRAVTIDSIRCGIYACSPAQVINVSGQHVSPFKACSRSSISPLTAALSESSVSIPRGAKVAQQVAQETPLKRLGAAAMVNDDDSKNGNRTKLAQLRRVPDEIAARVLRAGFIGAIPI